MGKLGLGYLVVLMAVSFSSGVSLANDLDNPESAVNAQPMNDGTTILRVDTRDKSAALLQTKQVLNSEEEAKALVANSASKFQPLPADKVRSELDQNGAVSSWYFYWGLGSYYYPSYYNYYYPTYYNYGSYYYPYYNYGYGYYNYYYYGYPGYYWRY